MQTWFVKAVALVGLALGLAPVARAQDGQVVYVGAAHDSRWQRLIERNDLPATPDDSFVTTEAEDVDFIESFREAWVLASSEVAAEARAACQGQSLSAYELILSAREELDVKEWGQASLHLEEAKQTWHCSLSPAPLSEISEIYFLQGVAAFLSGRKMGANPYFAVAFATGFEPPGVVAWPPDVREAYYNTAIDNTLVPKVPLVVDRDPLDGMKVWIDGREATEVYEIPVGEHVVQLTSASGRVVASTLINIAANRGGGLPLPGEYFNVQTRLETLKALEAALVKDSLTYAMQEAVRRYAEAEGYQWVIVGAVEASSGDFASFTASAGAEGSYERVHLRGSGLGDIGRFVYPGVTAAFAVGAAAGGAGYALAYQRLSTELYESQEAMEAAQTRGYVAAGIGVGCAVGVAVTATLWGVHRRRQRHELIYGQRMQFGVEPAQGGGLLTLSGQW